MSLSFEQLGGGGGRNLEINVTNYEDDGRFSFSLHLTRVQISPKTKFWAKCTTLYILSY